MNRPAYPKYKPSGVDWLGEVPEHWEVKRLKTAVTYRVSNVDKVPSEDEVPVRLCNYTDVYHHEAITPRMELMETTATADEIKKFQLCVGDVVITKDSEDWRDIGVPALVVETAPDLVCGYHLAIIRPVLGILLGKYLLRTLQSGAVNQQFQVASTGVTRYGLPKGAIGEAVFTLPPLPEQRAIADFLDRETGRIDTLVAKKWELIARLKERRAALITRAVTRGLDPAAKLKDSGVEWLGMVPEHWSRTRLKYAASKVIDCPHETPTYSPEGDYVVIRTADVSMGHLDLSTAFRVDESEYQQRVRRGKLEPLDIVYGREGERWGFGALVPAGQPACLGQRMMQFRASGHFVPTYLMWQLNAKSTYCQGQLDTVGATSPHVNVATIANYSLAQPPLAEQRAIADYLDRETGKLDHLTATVEAAIERLQEYRAALITAAVTGKIDVRGEANKEAA